MKEIKVTVDVLTNGDVTIDVDGVEGKKCLDLTKALEKKLGGDVNRNMKSDGPIFKSSTKKKLTLGGK
jgi:hypothetical protein|tara:strand:+ start:1168 stop:1371 length:204 start_codon:yes stop_codon:yes gene_type:complete